MVEYNGADFFGFQKQSNTTFRTVQNELELALSKFTNETINIITAGRTDTGVHATGQVINFTTSAKRPLSGFIRGTNAILPDDIIIRDATYVDASFNARFSALERTYHYYLVVSPTRLAIFGKKMGWYHQELDLDKMQQACSLLLGKHDFSCFRAANCQANNPLKIMTHSEVTSSTVLGYYILCFKFTANSFLYHMIRNIIGALVYVGKGDISIIEFATLITQKDRTKAPPTFMADGLYLTNISYPIELLSFDQQPML